MAAVVPIWRKSKGDRGLVKMNLRCVYGEYTASIRGVTRVPRGLTRDSVNENRFVFSGVARGNAEGRMKNAEDGGGAIRLPTGRL